MKNPDQEPIREEEIPNIAQFQVDRSTGNAAEAHAPKDEEEDEDYTEDEIPFADGEGTQLDEAIDEQEESDDDLYDEDALPLGDEESDQYEEEEDEENI